MSETAPDPLRVYPDGLADELGEWMAHNWAIETRDGDDRKVPKQPANPARNARSNDASTWGSFADALEHAVENDDLGFGFPCAQPGHPFVFLDVDIPDGDEWVPAFDRLGGAVVERSPSGVSRRIVLTGCEVPEWWKNQSEKNDDDETREVKVFSDTGYVTLTGDTIDGHGPPLEPTHSTALEQWLKEAWVTFHGTGEPRPWDDTAEQGGPAGSDPGSNADETAGRNGDEWVNADIAADALEHIDPDLPHDEWVRIGFSLGGHFASSTAERLFEQWSRGGTKWDAEAERRVSSIISDADGSVGISTLVYHAKQGGWDASTAAREATVADGGTTTATATESPADDGTADTDTDDGVSTLGWGEIRRLFRSSERGTTGEAAQAAAVEILDELDLVTLEENDKIWRYDPETGTFADDGNARIRKRLAEGLNHAYSRSRVSDILHRIRSETYAKRDTLGAPEGMICVSNGVLDLSDPQDPELLEHSPEYRFTWAMNAKYDPDAEAPEFRRFLGGSVRPEDIPKLQEYAGDALRHWQQPRNLCVLIGPTDAGKGVFIRALRAVFGDDNVASETLHDLTDTRWGAHSLLHRPINLANELSTGALERPEKAKNFSGGGDTISAENKGEAKYEMTPTANHLFATNQVPQVSNADPAFYNRWLFVTFPESVPASEQVEDLDARLVDGETERAGILNWLIEGYARRQSRTGTAFDGERTIAEKEDMWSAYGTSIDRFASTCLTTDDATDDDALAKKDVYAVYKTMCNAVGVSVESQQKLTAELKKEEGVSDGKRKVDAHFDDAARVRVFTGVQWTDDGETYLSRARKAREASAARSETDDEQTGLDDDLGRIAQQEAMRAITDEIDALTDEGRGDPAPIDEVAERVVHRDERARHMIRKLIEQGALREDPEGHVLPN